MKRLVAFLLAVSVCFGLLSITALGEGEADITTAIIITKEDENHQRTVQFGDAKFDTSITSIGIGYGEDSSRYAIDLVDGIVQNYSDVLDNYNVYVTASQVPLACHPDTAESVPLILLDKHEHSVDDDAWTKGETEHSGKCKTCGMTVKGQHSWMPEYSHDAKQHWKVCSDCGAAGKKVDHVGFEDGVCDECKFAAKVNITFDDGVNTPTAKEYECGQPLPAPTRDGYTFDGWFEGTTKLDSTTITPAMVDKTYTAKWTATGPAKDPIVDTDTSDKGGVGEDSFKDESGNLTDEDTTAIKKSEISITTGGADTAAAQGIADKASKVQANVDYAIEQLGNGANKDNIKFVAEPVLVITTTSYNNTPGSLLVKMEISAHFQVYAYKDGDTNNRVKIGKPEGKVDEPVTIVVGLPVAFHSEKNVYVAHSHYQYKAKNVGDGKFSFKNRHGFSEFTFGVKDNAVVSNSAYADEFEYLNFAKAAEDAVSGQTLTIKKDCSENLKLKDGVKVTLAKDVKFTGKINDESVELSADSVYTVGGTTPSGNGGSGGGSSKPSIKPGTTTTPTDPITNPEDQTGTGTVAGFSDVAASAWYADAVKYVVDRGLFGGVGSGRFAPDANMTRAMMWTVLARYKGVDTNTGSNWYEAARTWAMQQNISDGTMADGNVTREQFVTMLWRLSGEPAATNSASFTDNGRVSTYAKTAVDWAVAQGIVNGYNDGSFRPQGSATRAEVAKMLMVFCVTSEG